VTASVSLTIGNAEAAAKDLDAKREVCGFSLFPPEFLYLLRAEKEVNVQFSYLVILGERVEPLSLLKNRNIEEPNHVLFLKSGIASHNSNILGALSPGQRLLSIFPRLDGQASGGSYTGVKAAAFKQFIKSLLVSSKLIEIVWIAQLIYTEIELVWTALKEV
jgi:hypothetical protein